ncbi:MAG TPA: hypothetical protein VKQ54_13470 [Caulobacteraceae bacterium]|nr:hypothetical protein [Caulobacteraceae bacterium]
MITVYGGWPTRSFRVLWLLEEMGVPYALHAVDIRSRGADSEFQAINPAGFLPALGRRRRHGLIGRHHGIPDRALRPHRAGAYP